MDIISPRKYRWRSLSNGTRVERQPMYTGSSEERSFEIWQLEFCGRKPQLQAGGNDSIGFGLVLRTWPHQNEFHSLTRISILCVSPVWLRSLTLVPENPSGGRVCYGWQCFAYSSMYWVGFPHQCQRKLSDGINQFRVRLNQFAVRSALDVLLLTSNMGTNGPVWREWSC